MTLSNAELAELLARAAEEQEPKSNREKALRRASRAAFFWPEEASQVVQQDRPLRELPTVGPWLERVIFEWLTSSEPPEPPDPPAVRSNFLTLAEVRATLAESPEWRAGVRADLQMHTRYSDGAAPLREMVNAAASYGYEFIGITDHSKGLPIARGMDEARLAAQGYEIDAVNAELRAAGVATRVLKSIEMNVWPDGEIDMEPDALASLDLRLAAFHSKLRLREDQTERYVRAVENPHFDVLAHPRGRVYNRRPGLDADWPTVFAAAAAAGKALEIDAYPDRQDLEVDLLRVAREAGVWFSIGTDAHSVDELRFLEFGLAAAARADVPRERILNFQPVERVLDWRHGAR